MVERVHPAVDAAGWQAGYWRRSDTARILAEVHEMRPDMVFVGTRDARNGHWLPQNFRALPVPFACGVGRALDLYSGRLRPASRWAEDAGVGDTWVAVPSPGADWGDSVACRLRPRAQAGAADGAAADDFGRRSTDAPRTSPPRHP